MLGIMFFFVFDCFSSLLLHFPGLPVGKDLTLL